MITKALWSSVNPSKSLNLIVVFKTSDTESNWRKNTPCKESNLCKTLRWECNEAQIKNKEGVCPSSHTDVEEEPHPELRSPAPNQLFEMVEMGQA